LNTEKYRTVLGTIDQNVLSDASHRPAALRMYPQNGPADVRGISVFYAPFDHVTATARIVLLGITPGASQMHRAWRAARRAMDTGEDIARTMSEVKRVSSFNDESGQMRKNLYRQLEHWGVHSWLGLPSGESLFDEGWSQVQTTSLIQFPTFLHGGNYKGQSPKPLRHEFLASIVKTLLVSELRTIPEAIVFPLGPKVESVVRELQESRLISNPIQYGMFHPSGENTYRFDYLCGNRSEPPPYRTDPRAYDAGRIEFQKKYMNGAL
jgi:hypothetical protein